MSGIIAQNSGRHTGLVKASSGGGGVWNKIETLTASNSATLSFTSGINSTYNEYVFKFINVHPVDNATMFTFQADTGTNTNYNQTITSTVWNAGHAESGSETIGPSVQSTMDQGQGTSFQKLANNTGNENDESISGFLTIYNPSSSTYIKHFVSRISEVHNENYNFDTYTSGYINTATAITRFQFKFESGNIDTGTISLFGIS